MSPGMADEPEAVAFGKGLHLGHDQGLFTQASEAGQVGVGWREPSQAIDSIYLMSREPDRLPPMRVSTRDTGRNGRPLSPCNLYKKP